MVSPFPGCLQPQEEECICFGLGLGRRAAGGVPVACPPVPAGGRGRDVWECHVPGAHPGRSALAKELAAFIVQLVSK